MNASTRSTSIRVLAGSTDQRDADVACLRAAGYEVSTAEASAEIGAASAFPDIFLVNVSPREGDGFALTQKIRAISEKVGVLLVISAAMGSEKTRAFTSGADNFLTRPYQAQELLAVVVSLSRRLRLG